MVKPKRGGKTQAVKPAKTSKGTALSKILYGFENRTRNAKTEVAVILDLNGNVLLDKSEGHDTQVSFTQAEMGLMAGSILTHNHPNGTSFSDDDIDFLTRNKGIEIRAVTPYGAYVLRKKVEMGNNWMLLEAMERDQNQFRTGNLDRIYRAKQQNLINGKIDQKTFETEVNGLNKKVQAYRKQWMAKNASKYGYEYTFETLPKEHLQIAIMDRTSKRS